MNPGNSTLDGGQSSEECCDLRLDFGQLHAGDVIGSRFQLCKPIGQGGMGSVWLAEQLSPVKRLVAIKFLRSEIRTPRAEARFAKEHQALAMMNHPHIAQVYDGGETEQQLPYLVMEFVNGRPITEFCDRNRLTIGERLKLFVKVCTALEHAHQRGIIHRDLKPNNVLIGEGADGPVPKVIDFGLAKTLPWSEAGNDANTIPGIAVGTPSYMAPEQIAARDADIDTRTDVYALGVLLFELITGEVPFGASGQAAGGWLEMFQRILHEEPIRPSRRIEMAEDRLVVATLRRTSPRDLSRTLQSELDWIVLKAIEKNSDRRYEGVGAFRRDIHRYIHHQPVEAHPPSLRYQLTKFIRRHSLLAAALVAITLAVSFGLIAITWGSLRAREAEKEARLSLVSEKKSNERAQRALAAFADALSSASLSEADSETILLAHVVALHEISTAELSHHDLHLPIRPQKVGGIEHRIETMRSTLRVLDHLVQEQPNQAYESIAANVRYHLARSLEQSGELPEAEIEYRKALAQLQHLSGTNRPTAKFSNRLAATYEGLGRLLLSVKKEEGKQMLEQATRLRN